MPPLLLSLLGCMNSCSEPPEPAPEPAPAPAPPPAPPKPAVPPLPPGAVRIGTIPCEARVCTLTLTTILPSGERKDLPLVALPGLFERDGTVPGFGPIDGTWLEDRLALMVDGKVFLIDLLQREVVGAPIAMEPHLGWPSLAFDGQGLLLCTSTEADEKEEGGIIKLTKGDLTAEVEANPSAVDYRIARTFRLADGAAQLQKTEGIAVLRDVPPPHCASDFPIGIPILSSGNPELPALWAPAEGEDATALAAISKDHKWRVAGPFAIGDIEPPFFTPKPPVAGRGPDGWKLLVESDGFMSLGIARTEDDRFALLDNGGHVALVDAAGTVLWEQNGDAFLWPVELSGPGSGQRRPGKVPGKAPGAKAPLTDAPVKAKKGKGKTKQP